MHDNAAGIFECGINWRAAVMLWPDTEAWLAGGAAAPLSQIRRSSEGSLIVLHCSKRRSEESHHQ